MAEAWAKKAATTYLDGISGGAFSLLLGSGDNPQSSLGVVIDQVDRIVAQHFEAHYRQMFEDQKSSHFAAYNIYLQGTASFPFGAMVDMLNSPQGLTDAEEQRFSHVVRSLEDFNTAGTSLMRTGIFGRNVANRFRAAGVFMLINSQRLEVWKQLDFALGSRYSSNISTIITDLEEMRGEFKAWANKRIKTGPGTGRFEGRHFVKDDPDSNNVRWFSDRRKAAIAYKEAYNTHNRPVELQCFGENYDRILSHWKEVAAMG